MARLAPELSTYNSHCGTLWPNIIRIRGPTAYFLLPAFELIPGLCERSASYSPGYLANAGLRAAASGQFPMFLCEIMHDSVIIADNAIPCVCKESQIGGVNKPPTRIN